MGRPDLMINFAELDTQNYSRSPPLRQTGSLLPLSLHLAARAIALFVEIATVAFAPL